MVTGETRGSIVFGGEGAQRALTDQEEKKVLDIAKSLMNALGKFQQYPTINEIVLDAMHDCAKNLFTWLRTHSSLECVSMQGNLQVNKAILSMVNQKKDFVQAFLFYMTERNVRTMEFRAGLDVGEIQSFFEFFGKPARNIVAKKNMPRALKRMGIKNIRLSSELVIEDVIIKTRISDELSRQLSQLNVNELLEKANILSRLDINALQKVNDLATVVTNLSYTNNEQASRKILDHLSQTMHSSNWQSRLVSARAFSQIAEKAVDYTLYGLHSNVGEMMSDQLKKETDPNVYSTLAAGLEKAAQVHIAKGDYEQAMKIIDSFSQSASALAPEPTVKKRAQSAISNIGSPATIRNLVTSLEKTDARHESVPMTVLSGMGMKAVPELIDLVYTTEDRKVLERAVHVLKTIGPAAVAEIYSELNEDMEDRFRKVFIQLLAEIGDVRSVIKILPYLKHPNEEIRAETFRTMLAIGGPAAEGKVLEEFVTGDLSKEFFRDRLHAFGTYRSRTMVVPLLEYLEEKGPFAKYSDPDLEVQAVRSLSQIGGKDVVDGLCRILTAKKGLFGFGKGKEKLEVAICAGLGRMSDPSAEPALAKATKSKYPTVRSAAEKALEAVKHPSKMEKAPIAQTVIMTGGRAEDLTRPPAGPETAEPEEEWAFEELPKTAEEPSKAREPAEGVSRMRLILMVGNIIVDGVRVSIPGFDDQGKITADQQGVDFEIPFGDYDVRIKDKDFSVTKTIRVTEPEQDILVDLQDIFNF